jgi:hypothetical protein
MKQYTIKTIDHEVYQLNSTTDSEQLTINTAHPKWHVVNKAA